MEMIERVFLLQRVDLLQGTRSAHLALLAAIADPISVEPGTELLTRGQPVSAMFVVIRGAIELQDASDEQAVVEDGGAFGTWALIDDAPSMISARAAAQSDLLRINRSDFFDVLEDRPELAVGLLQGLARRVRTLVA
jgi:CRP-like cAMP-binding protein